MGDTSASGRRKLLSVISVRSRRTRWQSSWRSRAWWKSYLWQTMLIFVLSCISMRLIQSCTPPTTWWWGYIWGCITILNFHNTNLTIQRILESVARNCPDKELLAAALAQGPVLIKVLNILDGEEGKLVKKYSKMYSLVEYKDLIRMEEEGKLSQQEFQSKLEHLREKLM